MAKSYKKFNLICVILSAFFLLGTMWVGRLKIEESRLETEDRGLEIGNWKLEIKNNATTTSTGSKIEIVKILPDRINLYVPFTSQAPEKDWGQPWQDACEEAALLMLDAYHKGYNLSPLFAKDEIIKMVEWEQARNLGRSAEIKEIQEFFDNYFQNSKHKQQNSKIIENPTVEQIKGFIANGKPVLAVADGKVLPNPHFRNGGPIYHALIIRGYDEDEFITNDPGTQFGRNFRYKYSDLMNATHEWNGGDVKNGRKVILVVE